MLHSLVQPLPWLQVVCPALVLLALAALVLARRRGRPGLARAGRALLGVCALGGLLNYTLISLLDGEFFNEYEFFHYYLGTKYAEEIGYFHLYDAVVAADAEAGARPVEQLRDLRTNDFVPVSTSLERADEVKARFSEARWAEWRRDVSYFRTQVSHGLWSKMLEDKGYNATPVWTMVGGGLANRVPTSDEAGMLALPFADVGLWVCAFAAVFWAFGLDAVLLLVCLLGTHYVMSFSTLKAAYLRVDWIAALLGAMAFTKKGRPAAAGALVAWAGLSRVFPFVFAFGPGVTLVWRLARERRLDRDALRFLLGLAGTTTALVLVSLVATSPAYWREFLAKIGHHAESYTAWRIGFDYVLALAWDGKAIGGSSIARFYRDHAVLHIGVRLLALAGTAALALRAREPWHRLMLGFFLIFFLTGPTYYYYVVLLVPALWLAERPEDPRRAAVLGWVFVSSVITTVLHLRLDRSYGLFFFVSCAVLLQILAMSAILLRESRAPAPSP